MKTCLNYPSHHKNLYNYQILQGIVNTNSSIQLSMHTHTHIKHKLIKLSLSLSLLSFSVTQGYSGPAAAQPHPALPVPLAGPGSPADSLHRHRVHRRCRGGTASTAASTTGSAGPDGTMP